MFKKFATAAVSTLLASALMGPGAAASPAGFSLNQRDSLDESFQTYSHPAFPSHQLRFKRNDGWCDKPSVKSWSGYLDSADDQSHFFFYFFESRNDPSTDPVVLWINGGPGCSSSIGLLMELGPCHVDDNSPNVSTSTHINPYSWNNNANLLFLDQPVDVGFSYTDNGRQVSDTPTAAIDVQAFVALFFETFNSFKGRPFHFSGESYGGRYIPLFASEILYHNEVAESKNVTQVNLKSILIGNGLVDEVTTVPTYYDQACTNSSGAPTGPVLDVKTCAEMQSYLPKCKAWLKAACVDSHDHAECDAAVSFCETVTEQPYIDAKWNVYDVTKPCPDVADSLCYSVEARLITYLDRKDIRAKLGVRPEQGPFEECDGGVNTRFYGKDDTLPDIETYYYVTALVERGIDVLIYNGKYDWICNWLSNKAWLDNLVWSGSEEYLNKTMKPWYATVDGTKKQVGETKYATSLGGGRLTFATVEKAGHMVPFDQPEAALAMVTRTLLGQDL